MNTNIQLQLIEHQHVVYYHVQFLRIDLVIWYCNPSIFPFTVAPLHAAVEHRRCSSTDSLSLSCHLTPYSSTSSQGSPGSSHGSRGSSSCGSPPPPFYDSAPHYTDISNMTPRHQQPLQSNTGGGSGSGVGGAGGGLHQHHAAAAAAAGSPTIPVGPCAHVGSVGGAGAASVDMHHHHRVRRRRGHLNRFHSDTSEDICDPIGATTYLTFRVFHIGGLIVIVKCANNSGFFSNLLEKNFVFGI